MPRPKSAVPSYRKHPSGQARVTIGGRDYYLGPYGTQASKKAYDRVIAEYLASGRSDSFGSQADEITVAVLIRDYLRYAKGYYGAGNVATLRNITNSMRPLKKLYAASRAVDFGPDQYRAVREHMITVGCGAHKRKDGTTFFKPCARSTANDNMARILRMFKWAAGQAMLPASVYETLRLIPGLRQGRTKARETEPVKPVPLAVVEATTARLPSTLADMVKLQLLLGCRPSEVCALTQGMIDRTGDVWTASLERHKTAHHGHTRTLYFGPQAQAIVAKYLDRAPSDHLFRPIDTDAEVRAKRKASRVTSLSCGNVEGSNRKRKPKSKPTPAYSPVVYARAITRAAAAAGVEHWSPNQLRHARGTYIRAQFGLESSGVILGHADLRTTQIYAEADHAKALEVARMIG